MFSSSGVNLYDVYYILSKCDNVTSLYYTFQNCDNIVTTPKNSFNRNMFSHCTNVESITGLFYLCDNINTILYSPTHDDEGNILADDGLLSPLRFKCTDWSVWLYAFDKYFDSYLLNVKDDNKYKFTIINYMNGVSIDDSNAGYTTEEELTAHQSPIDVGIFFRHLPNLEEISYSLYSGMTLQYSLDTYQKGDQSVQYCTAFYNNPKLTSIFYSFDTTSSGNMMNIFGGNSIFDQETQHFPQALKSIRYSFNGGSGVTLPINNSFFRKIKNSIEYITGQSADDVNQSSRSFNVNKIYQPESEDEVFCYDIFKECVNIKHIPYFFSELSSSKNLNLELPGDMFINCTKLQNIDYLFSYMDSNIKYTLTSRGFKNCNLTRARGCFAENISGYNRKGEIPYGLFYQETIKTGSAQGWNDNDASSLNINENFGIVDGEWVSDEELDSPLPDPNTYSWNYKALNKTIKDLSYLFYQNRGTELVAYNCNYGDLTTTNYGDILCTNEAYNPVRYIVNPNYDPRETIPNPAYNPDFPGTTPETIPNPNLDIRRVILNSSYDPYTLKWNTYALDGNSSLETLVTNSSLYTSIQDGTFTSVSKTIPDDMFDTENDSKTCPNPGSQDGTSRTIMNYMCSSDLYLYCVNNTSTVINHGFYNCGRDQDSGFDWTQYGVRGRIPPKLFQPVNKITSLEGIFMECKLITPYTWNKDTELGLLFSPKLFNGLSNLQTLEIAFSYFEIPANIQLSSSTFTTNIQLLNLERAFMGANWLDTTNQQLPDDIFSRNNALQNIRGCFAAYTLDSSGMSEYRKGRSPKIIHSTLFTSTNHKNLNNVSYIFGNATQTSGSVPEFWNWLNNLNNANKAGAFQEMRKSLITNSSSIPASWSYGMTD